MSNETYAEWIECDGNAQRLYKAYRDKWPDGDAQCVAIGDEFYVRFNGGDGMRRATAIRSIRIGVMSRTTVSHTTTRSGRTRQTPVTWLPRGLIADTITPCLRVKDL